MKNAIILCCDFKYFLHTTSLFGSLMKNDISNNADLILIADYKIPKKDIDICSKKGINVIQVKNEDHGYNLKYYIYDKKFSVYENILYLDSDMSVIKNNINIFDNFNDNIGVDFEPFSLHQTMISLAPRLSKKELELLSTIPDKRAWNSGGILFKGKILENNLIEKMFIAKNKYQNINYHVRGVKNGGDQPIFNIVLDEYNPKQLSIFSYCKNITENTIFAHCCAEEKNRPWNNPDFINNYKIGLNYFESI